MAFFLCINVELTSKPFFQGHAHSHEGSLFGFVIDLKINHLIRITKSTISSPVCLAVVKRILLRPWSVSIHNIRIKCLTGDREKRLDVVQILTLTKKSTIILKVSRCKNICKLYNKLVNTFYSKGRKVCHWKLHIWTLAAINYLHSIGLLSISIDGKVPVSAKIYGPL